MQRISRALDNIFVLAKLYHEGHSQGTHDREVVEFLGQTDPIAAFEAENEHKRGHDITQTVLSSISSKGSDPDYVRYSYPYWWAQGYKHGRGGDYNYEGFKPTRYGVTYSPPKREDPMNRQGPFD
jgi:hypothetical protein